MTDKNLDSSEFDGGVQVAVQPSVGGLIARLEAATEKDEIQALSAEVAKAVDTWSLTANRWPTYPPYCESLDAALTLVPEGCRYEIEQSICGRWFDAYIYQIGESDEFLGDTPKGVKTAPLAICIAALNARKTVPQTKV